MSSPVRPSFCTCSDGNGSPYCPTHGIPTMPCRSCGVAVWMLKHERTGKVSPIEVEPSLAGSAVVDPLTLTWRVYSGLKSPDGDYHWPHFARCPGAAYWRRRTA